RVSRSRESQRHGGRTEGAPLCKRVAVGRRPPAGVVGRENTRVRVGGDSIDSFTCVLSPHTRAKRGPNHTPASSSASSARPLCLRVSLLTSLHPHARRYDSRSVTIGSTRVARCAGT